MQLHMYMLILYTTTATAAKRPFIGLISCKSRRLQQDQDSTLYENVLKTLTVSLFITLLAMWHNTAWTQWNVMCTTAIIYNVRATAYLIPCLVVHAGVEVAHASPVGLQCQTDMLFSYKYWILYNMDRCTPCCPPSNISNQCYGGSGGYNQNMSREVQVYVHM